MARAERALRESPAAIVAIITESGPSTYAASPDGVEDVYPGDVAQDWLARWRDNPKALERELAGG